MGFSILKLPHRINISFVTGFILGGNLKTFIIYLVLSISSASDAKTLLCSWTFNQKVSELTNGFNNSLYIDYAISKNFVATTFTPHYGQLKGITVDMPLFFLGKIDYKHGVTPAEVRLAFLTLRNGIIHTRIERPTNETKDHIRFYFVSKYSHGTKTRYLKVVFDERGDGSFGLTSAYPVDISHYQVYTESRASLVLAAE